LYDLKLIRKRGYGYRKPGFVRATKKNRILSGLLQAIAGPILVEDKVAA
jgi:hypothetical protein